MCSKANHPPHTPGIVCQKTDREFGSATDEGPDGSWFTAGPEPSCARKENPCRDVIRYRMTLRRNHPGDWLQCEFGDSIQYWHSKTLPQSLSSRQTTTCP